MMIVITIISSSRVKPASDCGLRIADRGFRVFNIDSTTQPVRRSRVHDQQSRGRNLQSEIKNPKPAILHQSLYFSPLSAVPFDFERTSKTFSPPHESESEGS